MAQVYVWTALWNIDTYIPRTGFNPTHQLADLNTLQRYQLMERTVEQAFMKLGKSLVQSSNQLGLNDIWVFLFVAPEYYFSRSDRAHAIDEDEKRNVVGRLATLSGKYTRLILVPGSIAWKKPAVRPQSELRKLDKRTGKRTGPEKTRTRLSKFNAQVDWSVSNEIALIEHKVQRHVEEMVKADPLRRSVYESDNYRMKYYTELIDKAKKRRKDEMTTMSTNLMTAQERCFIARNTAYAFYEGSEVARYHKRGNFYEVRDDESDGGYVMFEPGGGPDGNGDQFEVEGVKFGIEICLDHNIGFLSQTSQSRPDVHIIMSAAVKVVEQHVHVEKDCFMVHASSEKKYTGGWYNSGYKVEQQPMEEEPAERGSLFYGILPFKVQDPPPLLTLEDLIVNKNV